MAEVFSDINGAAQLFLMTELARNCHWPLFWFARGQDRKSQHGAAITDPDPFGRRKLWRCKRQIIPQQRWQHCPRKEKAARTEAWEEALACSCARRPTNSRLYARSLFPCSVLAAPHPLPKTANVLARSPTEDSTSCLIIWLQRIASILL